VNPAVQLLSAARTSVAVFPQLAQDSP